MARTYAWAPRGQRAYAAKPRNRGHAVTLIGALGMSGLVATMTVTGGTDGEVFRSYVDQVLVPQLRPGQVVLMDNLKAHKVPGIREAIEEAHATLRYLPSYSHDSEGYGGRSGRRTIKKEGAVERGRRGHATSGGSAENRAAADAPVPGFVSPQ
jgi:DDE superfamily endonuclease